MPKSNYISKRRKKISHFSWITLVHSSPQKKDKHHPLSFIHNLANARGECFLVLVLRPLVSQIYMCSRHARNSSCVVVAVFPTPRLINHDWTSPILISKPGTQIQNWTRSICHRIKWSRRRTIRTIIRTIRTIMRTITARQRPTIMRRALAAAVVAVAAAESSAMTMTASAAAWPVTVYRQGKTGAKCVYCVSESCMMDCFFFLWCASSGKSNAAIHQYSGVLKTILTELKERREDCDKMREKVERLEVRLVYSRLRTCLSLTPFMPIQRRACTKISRTWHSLWKANAIDPNVSRSRSTISPNCIK